MRIQTIKSFLTQTLPTLRLAVIGDSMVDRYVFGDVSRISPEAPVPVNRVTSMKEVLGGAANVAANLANLDCRVYIGGVAGKDDNWQILSHLLKVENIDMSGIIKSENRRTTTKMRIIGGRQQMMRLDFEEAQALTDKERALLTAWLENLCQRGLDGIVISDYGKGVCTPAMTAEVIRLAKAYGVLTIVDPKGTDWQKYAGADYITPNLKELEEFVGEKVVNEDATVVEAAKAALDRVSLGHIVATRSAKGITVVGKDGGIWHNPATQQEVFDVSGAGDTVVAMMITAMAAKLTMRVALHVANGAAGIVVSKIGTYPIHRRELLALWQTIEASRSDDKGVYHRETLAEKIRQWQANGEVVVFTNGCFDILHRGHVAYLQQAARLGDHLIIGLNSDASVCRLKGETRPLTKEQDRAFLLQALGCVDGVVIFEEDTPAELLAVLRPNILVKGGDYSPETVIGKEYVDSVQIIPFEEGYSTTGLVNKIATLTREGKL